MRRLENKVALVTGASKGIGQKIAEKFSSEGAYVGINYPPGEESNAENVRENIENGGGDAITLKADVSSEEDVKKMVRRFGDSTGPIDIVVNNAGGTIETSPITEMSSDLWDHVVNVNLKGVFLTSKFAIPKMKKKGDSSIINISSQLSFLGDENRVHYCAAKGGVNSLTRSLAHELGPEVRVNAIAPGPIITGKRGELTEDYLEHRTKTIPLERLGDPKEVASTAVFLASDEGSYYTGQILSPDGGEAMH